MLVSTSGIPNKGPKIHGVSSQEVPDLDSPSSVADGKISGIFSDRVPTLDTHTKKVLAEYKVSEGMYKTWLEQPEDALLWSRSSKVASKCSEVVLKAMDQQYGNFDYASAGLKGNQEFLFKCIDKADSYEKLAYMFNKLEYPIAPEVMLKAIDKNPGIISWLRDGSDHKKRALLENPAILSACGRFDESKAKVLEQLQNIARTGRNTLPVLKEVLKVWGGDREVVLAVVGVNGIALEFVSDEFKKDIDVAKAAVNRSIGALDFVDWSIQHKVGY